MIYLSLEFRCFLISGLAMLHYYQINELSSANKNYCIEQYYQLNYHRTDGIASCNIMDSIKAQSASNLCVLHLREDILDFLLVTLPGFSLQLQFCSKADDEGQHEDKSKDSACDDQFFLGIDYLFTVLDLVLFLSLLQFFLVFVLLADLIIQDFSVTLAVFHLPIQVGISVHFGEPPPDSFVLTHCLELCGFMQADFLKVRGGFLLEKLLIFFIEVDLDFWFRVSEVVGWLTVGLTYFLSCFSRLFLMFRLVLRFDANCLVVLAPFCLVAEYLVGFLDLLEAVSVCALVDVGMIDLGQFQVVFLDGGGGGVVGDFQNLVEAFLFLGFGCCEAIFNS